MDTCEQCGASVNLANVQCNTCGATVAAAGNDQGNQELTPRWRARFALIDKAGGPTLPAFKTLSIGERYRLRANWWAFFFGVFYYLAKGMWRKGITLCALVLSVMWMLDVLLTQWGMAEAMVVPSSVGPIVFAIQANIDYYKKVVLNQNGWW